LIVADTSALVAILRREPEADDFLRIIIRSGSCLVLSVSIMEASLVLAGREGDDTSWLGLDQLIARAGIEVVPQDRLLAEIAREAFLRFGKGRHPARLNMGDCAAYALARSRGLPLLFKGGDFSKTDIVAAE
jgi:ribonuclease VapC